MLTQNLFCKKETKNPINLINQEGIIIIAQLYGTCEIEKISQLWAQSMYVCVYSTVSSQ